MSESFNAYYYSLDATGVQAVDDILREVAAAGKRYHSTDCWCDNHSGPSCRELIQQAADRSADSFKDHPTQKLLEARAALEVILSLVANYKPKDPVAAQTLDEIYVAARMALGR